MIRWASILITVAACASSPPAARLFPPGTGECPDKDCGVALDEDGTFASPDDGHRVPPGDPDLGPSEKIQASCADVGISAASLQVGNYAEEAERAPIASKYRARCTRLRLDPVERQCVYEAPDAASMAYCAPRFWPELKVELVDPATCPALTNQIRDQMNAVLSGQPRQDVWDRMLVAIQSSCERDRWTTAFAQCAAQQQYPTYVLPYCQQAAPASLYSRMEDRLAKAAQH